MNQNERGWLEKDDSLQRHRPDGKGGHDGRHTTVGSYLPNQWGLYDMHGNVWEWCLDWHGGYSDGPVTDPLGAAQGWSRVHRGGCWSGDARRCRSAYRCGFLPGFRAYDFGCRVALVPSH